jgi:hypothetical protein
MMYSSLQSSNVSAYVQLVVKTVLPHLRAFKGHMHLLTYCVCLYCLVQQVDQYVVCVTQVYSSNS